MNVSHCLHVLSVARVMIAQWENECISLSACPLSGPGHDSSVGERMYLTVCPLRGSGSIPGRGRVFQRSFPWLITLCQPILNQ